MDYLRYDGGTKRNSGKNEKLITTNHDTQFLDEVNN